jgi:hypothetical protein
MLLDHHGASSSKGWSVFRATLLPNRQVDRVRWPQPAAAKRLAAWLSSGRVYQRALVYDAQADLRALAQHLQDGAERPCA